VSKNKTIDNQEYIANAYDSLKKKKKSLTRLESLKEEKKKDAEDSEILAVEGQESEKEGKKWVKEGFDQSEKEKKSIYDVEREWLATKRTRKDEDYLIALGSILYHRLKTTDAPLGYTFEVTIDGKKIKAVLQDRFGRQFVRGFTATGEVKYDYKAVLVMEASAQETIDAYENNEEKRRTESGLYLPPSMKKWKK